MKKENFRISEKEVVDFIDSCKETSGVNFIKYENKEAHIEYKHGHSLFYLGRIYQLKKIVI